MPTLAAVTSELDRLAPLRLAADWDTVGLLVGPMFVVMELLALAGLFKGLMAEVEGRAGPTHVRDLAHPVAR